MLPPEVTKTQSVGGSFQQKMVAIVFLCPIFFSRFPPKSRGGEPRLAKQGLLLPPAGLLRLLQLLRPRRWRGAQRLLQPPRSSRRAVGRSRQSASSTSIFPSLPRPLPKQKQTEAPVGREGRKETPEERKEGRCPGGEGGNEASQGAALRDGHGFCGRP